MVLVICPVAYGSDPVGFESRVLPLLQAKCLVCHGPAVRQGGLSLATRDDVLRGGKTGAAAVPGKPNESLLLTMVVTGKMPMGSAKLAENEIDLLRRWIETGARRDGEQEAPKLVSEREVFSTILGAKCFVCHGRRTQQAGLDLRTRDSLLRGGKSGPAIQPGKPDESLLIKKIAAQQMPPPKQQEQFSIRGVTQDEFDKLKTWIASGAPPDNEKPIVVQVNEDALVGEKGRQHWAFRPPVRPAVPAARATDKAGNPVDAFLLAKLEQKGITFSESAGRLTLMRRAYIDLIGMPPSPEEMDVYLEDRRPDAYERLVDQLLDSPRYGERWARYWLDAAGYADSEGGSSADNPRPHAWRYRDYVIRALNSDKTYDQFLTEQIAGDEMFDYKSVKEYTPDQIDKLVATGFLRMGPDPTYSTEQNFLPDRFDTIAGQMEILGTSVMGLTVACARCHDHKYDPIPQRDYYRMQAILMAAYDPYDWRSPSLQCVGVGAKCTDDDARHLPLRSSAEEVEIETHNAPVRQRVEELEKTLEAKATPYREKIRAEKLEALPPEVREDLKKALEVAEGSRTDVQKYLVQKFASTIEVTEKEVAARFDDYRLESRELQQKIRTEKQKLRPAPKIRALFDMGGEPTFNRILLRGEFTNPGALVEPGPPSVLSASLPPYRVDKPAHQSGTSGRRLAFARWLTHPSHPLTARVMVNRIWQQHFGAGLVTSAGNFGRTGAAPTHPELLDWMAAEFVRSGWSIKAVHRMIMTSNAYRQSSRADKRRHEADPGNHLLSRFPLRRMDADALYDSILKVSGLLDETPFGFPAELTIKPDGEVIATPGKKGYRRAIYLQQRRSRPVTMLDNFDAPLLNPNCIRRGESTVSLQALQMMNSGLLLESARHAAGRVMDAAGDDPAKQVERAYRVVLSRAPTAPEAEAALSSLEQMRLAWQRRLEREKIAESIAQKSRWMALASLCHTLMNASEFAYVD